MDCSLKPNQRNDILGRRTKGKRGPEENGGGPLSEPEEGAPPSNSSSCWKKNSNKRRKIEVKTTPLTVHSLEILDVEIILDQTAVFIVSWFLMTALPAFQKEQVKLVHCHAVEQHLCFFGV